MAVPIGIVAVAPVAPPAPVAFAAPVAAAVHVPQPVSRVHVCLVCVFSQRFVKHPAAAFSGPGPTVDGIFEGGNQSPVLLPVQGGVLHSLAGNSNRNARLIETEFNFHPFYTKPMQGSRGPALTLHSPQAEVKRRVTSQVSCYYRHLAQHHGEFFFFFVMYNFNRV